MRRRLLDLGGALQERERRPAGPLEVVEHERGRSWARPHDVQDGVEEAGPIVVVGRDRDHGEPFGQRRQVGRGRARGTRGRAPPVVPRSRSRTNWSMAAQRWAKPSETVGSNDTQIVSVSVVAVSGPSDRRLADPGFAAEHDRSRRLIGPRATDGGDDVGAADEGLRRRRRRRGVGASAVCASISWTSSWIVEALQGSRWQDPQRRFAAPSPDGDGRRCDQHLARCRAVAQAGGDDDRLAEAVGRPFASHRPTPGRPAAPSRRAAAAWVIAAPARTRRSADGSKASAPSPVLLTTSPWNTPTTFDTSASWRRRTSSAADSPWRDSTSVEPTRSVTNTLAVTVTATTAPPSRRSTDPIMAGGPRSARR